MTQSGHAACPMFEDLVFYSAFHTRRILYPRGFITLYHFSGRGRDGGFGLWGCRSLTPSHRWDREKQAANKSSREREDVAHGTPPLGTID